MSRSPLSLTCTLPELPLLPTFTLLLSLLTLLPLWLLLTPLPLWLLPQSTPVTTSGSLPARTLLTPATLSQLSPPLLRNREFNLERHRDRKYFPRLHPDKKSDGYATSD